MVTVQRDPVVSTIIEAAIDVPRCLGPGLMENVYQRCLMHELLQRDVPVEAEVPIPVMFKGVRMAYGFRADLLVDRDVIIEVKSVERLMPVHTAQVLTYLRLTAARQAPDQFQQRDVEGRFEELSCWAGLWFPVTASAG